MISASPAARKEMRTKMRRQVTLAAAFVVAAAGFLAAEVAATAPSAAPT